MIPLDDKKKLRFFLKLMFGGVILCVSILVFFKYKMDKYPVLSTKEKISGEIENVKKVQSVSIVKIKNGAIWRLMPSRNYLYKDFNLNEFITKGDSIYKNSGSDSVFIKRKDNTYYFVLGQFINGELKK